MYFPCVEQASPSLTQEPEEPEPDVDEGEAEEVDDAVVDTELLPVLVGPDVSVGLDDAEAVVVLPLFPPPLLLLCTSCPKAAAKLGDASVLPYDWEASADKLMRIRQSKHSKEEFQKLTPHHDATIARVGGRHLLDDRLQLIKRNVARASGGRGARDAEHDLDLLVRRGLLRPCIPGIKVETVAGGRAIVIVELNVDRIKSDTVDHITENGIRVRTLKNMHTIENPCFGSFYLA